MPFLFGGPWDAAADAKPEAVAVISSGLNDRLFGVPLYADVSALFYNKNLFTQAGLDPTKPPTSLAELRELARGIQVRPTGVAELLSGRPIVFRCT